MKTEYKIIGGIGLLSLTLLIGGAFFLSGKESKNASIPEDKIITKEGLHWHPTLEIYIKGKKQEIPKDIGLSAVHQEIHTHEDADKGILHMEMSGIVTKDETELGNFFKIWAKKFSAKQIFDYRNSEDAKVKTFVNGKENLKFDKYHMKDKDRIEIRYE